jgi:ferric-dicitrate binding protein FerR (iron transport regulator)
MMGYQHYSVEDFLADESFQQYCSGTDAGALQFWTKALQEEPEIEATFQEAVYWYQLLNARQGNLREQTSRLQQRLQQHDREAGAIIQMVRPLYRRWWAAAAVFLLLATSGYFLWQQNVGTAVTHASSEFPFRAVKDMAPGGDKAVLTLADGSKVTLDTAANGAITKQGDVTVMKLGAQLAYTSAGNPLSTTVLYNTITTPRGGQYRLVLADGTKVWLNAASSLRFPTAFTGRERAVEVTGEAYFEVTHNAAMPFVVRNGQAAVTVLGTHFNVMAYQDEPSLTVTLLQGSVRVSQGNATRLLQPGQQASIGAGSAAISIVKDIDVDHIVSWKNGLFDFDDESLAVVMRQLSRWYDAEVRYTGEMPEGHYTGAIRRQANLSEVLKMLELAGGVHFSIEQKRIVVQKSTD